VVEARLLSKIIESKAAKKTWGRDAAGYAMNEVSRSLIPFSELNSVQKE